MAVDGTPIWADITVSDIERSIDFYHRLLGWDFDPDAGPEMGGYRNARLGGGAVAGLSPAMPGQPDEAAALSGRWCPYLATSDVAATALVMGEGGAQLLLPPMPVGPFGHMAVLRDPQGAVVALWQAAAHAGFEVRDTHGAPCWVDLMTTDAQAAKEFYGAVFGYTYQAMDPDDDTYALVSAPGVAEPVAGLMQWSSPSAWSIAFQVDDLATSLTQAASLQAPVLSDIEDIGFGHTATIAGPDGEVFNLFQPQPPLG
ncbi:MAG: VOC family protein [Arachnia sp.]